MEQNKKRRNIGIIAGVVVVLLIAGISAALIVLNQPKVRLARGISKMSKELTAYSSPAAKQINKSLLQKNTMKGPYTLKIDMTATFPENDTLSMLNMDLEAGCDNEVRQANIDFNLGAYQMNLVNGTIMVDDNTMYVSVPKLLNDTYRLQLDTLGADYNASAWKDQLGFKVDSDVSIDFFTREDADYTDMEELMDALSEDAQTLKDTIVVQKASDKASIKTSNKSMQCSGVNITIPKDAMNVFLNSFQEKFMASSMYQQGITKLIEQSSIAYLLEDDIRELVDGQVEDALDIRCMNDISLNLYMDSKGRIVRIMTPQAIECKDSQIKSMELSADLAGTDRTLDVIEAACKLNTVNGTETYSISRDASVTDEEYKEDITLDVVGTDNMTALTMRYKNTWKLDTLAFDGRIELESGDEKYKLSADGSYKDIVEGQSYTLDLDTASLEVDDKALMRIAGTFGIEQGMGEVEIPQDSIDLMQMDSTSIYQMFYQMLTAL